MAKKDNAASRDKKHKATVKKLEAAVARAEDKAARWKKRAKQERSAAGSARAEVAKLEKKLAKWRRKATSAAEGRAEPTAAVAPAAEDSPVEQAPPAKDAAQATKAPPADPAPAAAPASGPDDSWTVAALRAEARSRGLTGYSNKSKAELLAALT